MKRNYRVYFSAVLLLAVLLLSMLTGCGSNPSGEEDPAPSGGGNEETLTPEGGDPAGEPEGNTVTVSSAKELLEAIGPKTRIVIKPGYYNLSEYIEELWKNEGESWNEKHPYAQLRSCYDGVEVVIRGVDGLSIFGDSEEKTEIVVDPRYAQVLTFEECYDISLQNLTMGHTETGECSGNVLNFHGCRDISLSAMDLYGCGVYGIGCCDGTGELYVYSSTIRDCSYGTLNISGGNGRFEFRDCVLTGSEGYGYYEKTPYSELAFYGCTFGDNETSCYKFREDIYTEDCIWSENYVYPEYGYDEEPVFDPDTMESAAVDNDFLADTFWIGYAMVNPESGETVMLPYEEADGSYTMFSLLLSPDGTGRYDSSSDFESITWSLEEDGIICIERENGWFYYMGAYTMGEENRIWMLLELEECLVWLH